MSKLSDQQLDDLFKGHLMDLEKEPPVGSWQTLAKNVTKKNFLKFGWKHFNIFYAGAAVVSLSAGIYFTVLTISPTTENNVAPQETIIPFVADTIEKTTSTPMVEESIIKKPIPNNLKKEHNPAEISSKEIKKDSMTTPVPSMIENVPEIKISEPEKKETTPAPKAKKIITIIKRDTIRVKDTINKERIRW